MCCLKILIVDEDYHNIFALQKIISTFGFPSDYAFNGLEALEKIKTKQRCEVCE